MSSKPTLTTAANSMRFETRRGAKDKVIAWLVSYNRRRLHARLGYMISMQYEQRWLAGQLKTVNL